VSYHAVLFDPFDTLLYTIPAPNRGRAFALLESLGISEDDWRRGWRASFDVAVRGQTADMAERVALTLREAGVAPLPPETVRLLVSLLETRATAALYDDVPGTIAALRTRGYRVGLISNLTTEEKGIVDEFNLRSLFDVAVVSYEIGMAKPEAGVFLHAAERLGLAPEGCVFVDDQPRYLAGGIAAGMCGVLIRRPNAHDHEGPCDIECALRITELSELLEWLPARAGD
jgi:putative hydrolase of the HAD superfamily